MLNAIFVTFSPKFKMLAKQESYVAFSIVPHSMGHIVGGQKRLIIDLLQKGV